MKEKQIEKRLTDMVKARGGMSLKFISPGNVGMPDRIVLFPEGRIGFVELKAPGKRLRPLQEKRKRQLEGLGFLVFCLDSVEEIPGVIAQIKDGGYAR